MNAPRLTLLPDPVGTPTTSLPKRRWSVVDAVPDQLPEVTSVSRLAQGGRWRTEAMRSYERPVLIWFTRGQGRITIAGRSGGYSPHSAIFLPAGTMHGFSVTPAVLGSVVHLSNRSESDWPSDPVHLRLREVHMQRELTAHIDNIETEALGAGTFSHDAIRHHAALLAIWFARTLDHMQEKGATTQESSAAHRLAQAYTALVEKHFRSPEGVQRYAELLGVTPTHLTRACKFAAGRTALEILSDRRHFEACKLLKGQDLPIAKIAEMSGFASPAYFTRAFRARQNQSPSEFRKAG